MIFIPLWAGVFPALFIYLFLEHAYILPQFFIVASLNGGSADIGKRTVHFVRSSLLWFLVIRVLKVFGSPRS